MIKKISLIIGLVATVSIAILVIFWNMPKNADRFPYGMGAIPIEDHSPQCLNSTTTLANGQISYPNDYPNLPFLGQLFTSFKCANGQRIFQMPGVNTKSATYGPGIKIWLHNPASSNLLHDLKRIGFNCSEQSPDDACRAWLVDKEIDLMDVEDLMIHANEMEKDDCLKCR